MGFDGLRSQPQPLPNPAIGEALGDQAEDFAFAWGQLIEPTLSRGRRRVRKALEQFTSSDPCGHVLGLLAIGRPVLEFGQSEPLPYVAPRRGLIIDPGGQA